jgi:hypothetical protein
MSATLLPDIARRPYTIAFAWAGIWLTLLTAAAAIAPANFSSEVFGRLLAMTAISAGIVGFQGKRSKTPWSFWKTGGIYVVAMVAVWLVASYGAMQHR